MVSWVEMVDLSTYRARIGRFHGRGGRGRSKMDPFRWRYRLTKTCELVTCIALLLAWGMVIQACINHDRGLQNSRWGMNSSATLPKGAETGILQSKWERGRFVTSPQTVSTHRSVMTRGDYDAIARGHRPNMAKVVTHFRFDNLPADGDIHPHPGPVTPSTTNSATSPSCPDPPVSTSPTTSLPPIHRPRTRHLTLGQPVSSSGPTTTASPFMSGGTMGHNPGQGSIRHPIGAEERGERSSTTSQMFINTDNSMASSLLPSQIPYHGEDESGSPVDDTLSSGIEGPWTSTQLPTNTDISNDQEYGDERTADSDTTSSSVLSDLRQGGIPHSSSNLTFPDSESSTLPSQTANPSGNMNFSTGPNFEHYANASVNTSGLDGTNQASQSDFVFGHSTIDSELPSSDSIYGAGPTTENSCQPSILTVSDSVSHNSSAADQSIWVGSMANDIMRCENNDDDDVYESEANKVREKENSMKAGEKGKHLNTDSSETPTAHTRHTNTHTRGEKESEKESVQVNPDGSNPTTNLKSYCPDDSPRRDKTADKTTNKTADEDNLQAQCNPQSKETPGRRAQTDEILQALANLSSKMAQNQEQQTQNQKKTQQALDMNNQATRKTQEVIDIMHRDIKKAHLDIKQNQDKTQQSFHTTNTELARVSDQVEKTLGTLTEVREEIQETKTGVETNKKDLMNSKSDIQKNSDDIKLLKEELKEVKTKQKYYDKQQDIQQSYNDRNDLQRDRQEILNRRNNIVFFGILEKEGRGRERSDEVVIDVLQEYMPDGNWTEDDCVTAYRAGRRYDSGKPRPIIATFDKPSDVAFILKNRQGRDDMKKDGYGCGQDLTRAQKQKIYDIKQEGKHAYYTRGRLVVKDPHYDFRNKSRQENEDRFRHRRNISMNIRMDKNMTQGPEVEIAIHGSDSDEDDTEMQGKITDKTDKTTGSTNDTDVERLRPTTTIRNPVLGPEQTDPVTRVHTNDVTIPDPTESTDDSRRQGYGARAVDNNNDASENSNFEKAKGQPNPVNATNRDDYERLNLRDRHRTRVREDSRNRLRERLRDSSQRRRWVPNRDFSADRNSRDRSSRRHPRMNTNTTANNRNNPDLLFPKHQPAQAYNSDKPNATSTSFSSCSTQQNTPPQYPNPAPPPTFQQFQQLHNFFTNLNHMFQHQQQHSTNREHTNSNQHSNTFDWNFLSSAPHTHNNNNGHPAPKDKRQPPPPPPPPPPRGGGGGGGGRGGVWGDQTGVHQMRESLRNDLDANGHAKGKSVQGTHWEKLGPIPSQEHTSQKDSDPNSNPEQSKNVRKEKNMGKKCTGSCQDSQPADEDEKQTENGNDDLDVCDDEQEESESEKDDRTSANKSWNERRVNGCPVSDETNNDKLLSQATSSNTQTPLDNQRRPEDENEKEDENEQFEDAREDNDLDSSLEITDEYIELKTRGAKTLEALTPKPKRKRRNKQQEKNPSGSKDSPVILDETSNNSCQIIDDPVVTSHEKSNNPTNENETRSEQASQEGNSTADVSVETGPNTKSSQQQGEPSQPVVSSASAASSASDPPYSSDSVGKNGHDVITTSQSNAPLEDQVKAANLIYAEREKVGQGRPETMTESDPCTSSTKNTPSGNKQSQARITFGGTLRKPESDEESVQSTGSKGKGGKKNKGKKSKAKGNQNNNPERKLRSQSISNT